MADENRMVCLRFKPSLIKAVKRAALESDRTMTQFLADAAEAELKRERERAEAS